MTHRYSQQFKDKIAAGLRLAAKPDCAICNGAGVIDVGRGDVESLMACKCVDYSEKENE